jgi:AcrR family transcriptional regulator
MNIKFVHSQWFIYLFGGNKVEDIKVEIFQCAKELFSLKGFKDTNVSDITKKAGIAVGSFYKYYSSKDELFMEIFFSENEKLKKSFESVDIDGDPTKAILEILSMNYNGISSNPILREWYNRELFSKLEKQFHAKGGMKSVEELMNSDTLRLIDKWKSEGKIRTDLEDGLILALFNAIPYVDLHKEEIGLQHFPLLTTLLTEFVMKGLTDKNKTE